jgi:hypothetical protein
MAENRNRHRATKASAGSNHESDRHARNNKSGGTMAAEKEPLSGVFETMSEVREKYFSFDGAKKIAAWYIDTNEKIANQVLDFQASATAWAKETPLAPIFEAQNEFGRKVIERSAEAARSLWRLN